MFNTLAGLFLLQPLLQPSLLTGRCYRDVVGGGWGGGGQGGFVKHSHHQVSGSKRSTLRRHLRKITNALTLTYKLAFRI